jgi:hypothetical protein
VVDARALGDRLQVAFARATPAAAATASLTAALTAAGLLVGPPRAIAPTLEDVVVELTRQAAGPGGAA